MTSWVSIQYDCWTKYVRMLTDQILSHTLSHTLLTCVVVQEPVLSSKHLRGLHDDSIRKLISHCGLSHSL